VDVYDANEATGQFFFYLVDATDGITPETGEAGGLPQRSVNGGGWTSTDLATLSHIGNGHYRASLTISSFSPDDIIIARYKSANTAEAPALNTIKIRNTNDTLGGTAFTSGTHSLVALRNYLAASIVPLLNIPSSVSALAAGSFLQRAVAYIRKATDEPAVNAKYDDEDIIALMRDAWGEMWVDLNNNTRTPINASMEITITDEILEYALPPCVGRVERLVYRDADSNAVLYELDPRGRFDQTGWGWRVEGNTLRLGRKWLVTDTLQLEYIPSGDVGFIAATWTGALDYTGSTVTLSSTTTNGVLDTRLQAYTGYMLRTLPIQQEHIIATYDHTTLDCTLWTALNPEISLAGFEPLNYEVMPWMNRDMERAVMIRTALIILSNEGNAERLATQEREYVKAVRSVRMSLGSRSGRKAGQFDAAVPENRRRNRSNGYGVIGRR
jgi:hypothetical protein